MYGFKRYRIFFFALLELGVGFSDSNRPGHGVAEEAWLLKSRPRPTTRPELNIAQKKRKKVVK